MAKTKMLGEWVSILARWKIKHIRFRRINLANASVDQLKHLVEACDLATFGLDQKDVHDESYRKALKLDGSDFATKLDVVRSGLVDSIRNDLLEGDKGRRSISAELYKLNIYGMFSLPVGFYI